MALKLWNLIKIFVVLQWTIGTCSISLETNLSPHWSHDQLPLQKMAEACVLDIRWELNFASYVLKKIGMFENIFRDADNWHTRCVRWCNDYNLDNNHDNQPCPRYALDNRYAHLCQSFPKICRRYAKGIFKYAQDIH